MLNQRLVQQFRCKWLMSRLRKNVCILPTHRFCVVDAAAAAHVFSSSSSLGRRQRRRRSGA